ncbi:MAG: UDP-N-acetylmuramate dehydrogenase [Bdellovibrionales bacterium]|nr:UDP-N-acetylmuramate dehydrogenase [Bdellovibrionales bacterium]
MKNFSIDENVSLASYTWWKIGGKADYFASPKTLKELEEVLIWVYKKKIPLTLLGGGSNALISDQGIAGLTLATRQLNGIESVEETHQHSQKKLTIVCLSGTNKSELFKIFMQHKLSPAQFLCGIPGEVGGGIAMNAGVGENLLPREFVEIVDWIEVMGVEEKNFQSPTVFVKRMNRSELQWSYRSCLGWQPGVIVRACLSWPLQPDLGLMQKVREATRQRKQKQPLNQPSAGSVFRNPPGHKAGALIEQSGLKGFQIGQAQVSPKHANFIVNLGGAKADEVFQVISHVKKEVLRQHGVLLETEIKFLGRGWTD